VDDHEKSLVMHAREALMLNKFCVFALLKSQTFSSKATSKMNASEMGMAILRFTFTLCAFGLCVWFYMLAYNGAIGKHTTLARRYNFWNALALIFFIMFTVSILVSVFFANALMDASTVMHKMYLHKVH
jgi:hypothetical protein